MAFADGNTHGWEFTVPAAQVAEDATNFAVLLTSANMPASLAAYLAANGGGSLRAYADLAQTTRYALEYVSAGEVWICLPALSASVDNTFRVFWGGALNQPAVGAAYGRNAVWADWAAVYHFAQNPAGGSLTDSAGAYDAVIAGTPVLAAGPVVTGWDLDTTSYAARAAPGVSIYGQQTVMAWARKDGVTEQFSGIVCSNTNSTVFEFVLELDATTTHLIWGGRPVSPGTIFAVTSDYTITNGVPFFAAGTLDAAADLRTLYVDGVFDKQAADTGVYTAPSVNPLWLGAQADGFREFNGLIDETRIRASALSADSILTEYRAQGSPGTFCVAGAEIVPPPGPPGGSMTLLWSYYGG